MKRSIMLMAAILVLLPALAAFSQTTIESSMDWSSGMLRISAARPLDPGQAPDDHPQALEDLERELKPLVLAEFGDLAWDNRGTLADLTSRNPASRNPVENLVLSMKREWSRLSEDYKSVEAEYVVNLAEEIPEAFPGSAPETMPAVPPGWKAVPEDDWTGIVIYAPADLPVRGTGLEADARPALRGRILTDDLEVLVDPAAAGSSPIAYLSLDDRRDAESLVGRRPFRALARGLYGDFPCDIILSREDTDDILASESGRRALAEGRIVILLDGTPE